MVDFKKLPAMAISLHSLSILFMLVLSLFALGKFGVLPEVTSIAWIQGTILAFGAVVLFFETFRETHPKVTLATVFAVFTIAATALLAMGKFAFFEIPFIGGFSEGVVFAALAGLLLWELVLEVRK